MADENGENGSVNGNVPVIELIIKREETTRKSEKVKDDPDVKTLDEERKSGVNLGTYRCTITGGAIGFSGWQTGCGVFKYEGTPQAPPASTIDGRRKGACLFCQEYFMDLYLLAELKTISLKVTTVNMQKPPPDFRTNFEATPPPILIDGELAVLENDKIERHIMKNIPGGHNLFVQDKEVATLIENLYSKLKLALIKKEEGKPTALLSHLRKINDHLAKKGTRFLTGDTMCCFDCELMPRLQHIRVAGKYFVDFEIPGELTALWRYMYHMYQLDAFTQSCPADQDIINHYKLQIGMKMKKHEELETPTFTTSIPVEISLED